MVKGIIRTGNLLSHITPQKTNQEEFEKGIAYAIENNQYQSIPDNEKSVQDSDALRKCHKCIFTNIRLYLNPNSSPECIENSINVSLSDLSAKYIDLVHLSVPWCDQFPALWKMLESLVDKGQLKNIGVHDFTQVQLDSLLKCSRIKPYSNRIASASQELVSYCQKMGIKLIAAPPEAIKVFTPATSKYLDDSASFKWMVRYVITLECQSLILNRGYILNV